MNHYFRQLARNVVETGILGMQEKSHFSFAGQKMSTFINMYMSCCMIHLQASFIHSPLLYHSACSGLKWFTSLD